MPDLFDRFQVIDVDTHLTEPPDVWTARMPTALHDRIPHIERVDGRDVWMADGNWIGAPGYYSMAGWDGVLPVSTPPTFDDIAPSMFDSTAHWRRMVNGYSSWAPAEYSQVAFAARDPLRPGAHRLVDVDPPGFRDAPWSRAWRQRPSPRSSRRGSTTAGPLPSRTQITTPARGATLTSTSSR